MKTKFCDSESLVLALRDLGYEVKENHKIRGSFDTDGHIKVDIAAILDNRTGDMGWKKNNVGTYDFVGDLLGLTKEYKIDELVQPINEQYEFRVNAKHKNEESVDDECSRGS